MTISGEFSDFLTTLYASTASPTDWRSMAPRIATLIDAHSCQIGIWSPTPGASQRLSWTDNYTPALNSAYQAKYYAQDPWVAWVRQIQPGSLVTGDVTTITPQFTKSEIYNDYCRALGIYHVVGAGVARMAGGGFSIVGLHKERRAGMFSAKQTIRLRSLLPHLRQAMVLREKIGHLKLEGSALFTALESLQMGVIIVDMHGRLLFADSTALSIVDGHSQLSLRNGRLRLAEARQDAMLTRFVADAASTGDGGGSGPGGLLTLRSSVAQKLALRVCPLPLERFADSVKVPAAIIFLRRPDSRPIALQRYLTQSYGLTRAEARLAEALINGRTLAEYAADARVSMNTVKTLSKRVYAKTGHHSRSRLIRDVLSSPFLTAYGAHPRGGTDGDGAAAQAQFPSDTRCLDAPIIQAMPMPPRK